MKTSLSVLATIIRNHYFIVPFLLIGFCGCDITHPNADAPKINSSTANARASSPTSLAQNQKIPSGALLPDLQTVVPQHLQVVRDQQKDWLRFSNGVANTGTGALQLKPEYPINNSDGETQKAIQQLMDAQGQLVYEQEVSQFEYHPEHNHWHIDAVALFEIRAGSYNGKVVGNNSIKTTFCLIDWIKLEGNSNSKERVYFDCFGVQGISAGWVDQYNQAVEGQELDITDVPAGRYFLISTANPDKTMIESSNANNTAWTSFDLMRDRQGHPKITIVGHSDCTGGLCGYAPNR